jgi:Photosynthesis system II assembly factor YCF48
LGVHFADAHTGWAVGVGGTILATRDGGTHWEPRNSRTDSTLLGVHFADAHAGWAVGVGGTILATRDGGINWERQNSRSGKNLFGVHFAVSHTGCARGTGGTMLRSSPPIYPPLIEDPKVASKGLDALDVSFRVKSDRGAEITAAHVSARIGEADAGDGRWQLWHLTWKPKTTVTRRSWKQRSP